MSKTTLRFYGAGGAGINLALQLAKADAVAVGYAKTTVGVLDTSFSNINGISSNVIEQYILEGKDGSGSKRNLNAADILREAKQALQVIKPANFNVVAFSGMGGTGSVFGPAIVKELLEANQPVVAIVIGGDESMVAIDNLVQTLNTLAGISKVTKKALNFCYAFNHRDKGYRKEADAEVLRCVRALSLLASGENEEMDSQDIFHWLNYDLVAKNIPPQLGVIDIDTNPDEVDSTERDGIISMASIYASRDENRVMRTAPYSTVGYSRIALGSETKSLHLTINPDAVNRIHQKLSAKSAEIAKASESAAKANRGILGNTEVDESGFSF